MSLSFTEKWNQAISKNNSLVCVGLDTDPAQLPASVRAKADPVLYFNQQIIDATCDLVCCYKPNFAFYSALGASGFATLKRTLDHIPEDIPVLIDAKVGDMRNTAEQYARAFYEVPRLRRADSDSLFGPRLRRALHRVPRPHHLYRLPDFQPRGRRFSEESSRRSALVRTGRR